MGVFNIGGMELSKNIWTCMNITPKWWITLDNQNIFEHTYMARSYMLGNIPYMEHGLSEYVTEKVD